MSDIEIANEFINDIRQKKYSLDSEYVSEKIGFNFLKPNKEKDSACSKFRQVITLELFKTYTKDDKQLIKYLLEQDIYYFDYGFDQVYEILIFMLYNLAETSDIEQLWLAKNSNFDTYCGIDIQLVAVPDIDEALEYLKGIDDEWAGKAFEKLTSSLYHGDIDEKKYYIERKVESYIRSGYEPRIL